MFWPTDDETGADLQERDQLRYERHKERERERRLARAHPERRSVCCWHRFAASFLIW